jgi:hypothetical protein
MWQETDAIMPIKRSRSSLWAATFFVWVGVNLPHAAPPMIVGNDEKLLWDDNGKPIISPAGKECRYGSANFFTQEVAYLDQYRREYEITKRVSVARSIRWL